MILKPIYKNGKHGEAYILLKEKTHIKLITTYTLSYNEIKNYHRGEKILRSLNLNCIR